MNIIIMMRCLLLVLALTILTHSQTFVFADASALNSTTLSDLRSAELNTLNFLRGLHGSKALVLNQSLNSHAQAHVQSLFAQQTLLGSSEWQSGSLGENLLWDFQTQSVSYQKGSAVSSWYRQNSNYNFTSGEAVDPSLPYKYFTAEIWKGVSSVGFGFYGGKDQYFGNDGYSFYVVANFYPAPNVNGQFLQNVPLLISSQW